MRSLMMAEPYELPWTGEPFTGKVLALDTETNLVDLKRHVPEVVLATVSNGTRHAVLRPDQLPDFILQVECNQQELVFHNAAFDFWAVEKYLNDNWNDGDSGYPHVLVYELWWKFADCNRIHDTMLMDMLVRLAKGIGESGKGDDDKLYSTPLDKLGSRYNIEPAIDKENVYRLRFAEIGDTAIWPTADKGFFDYAIADTVVTARLWLRLLEEAQALSSGVSASVKKLYGHLTEQIQIKAAIAFSAIGRNGLGFDAAKAVALEQHYRNEYQKCLEYIATNYPDLLKRYKKKNNGGYQYSKKSGTVCFSTKNLRILLGTIASTLGINAPVSKGKQALTSGSVKDWSPWAEQHDFLKAWTGLSLTTRQLGFFKLFRDITDSGYDRIHSRYNTLVRTGRGSCSDPNAQQFPRGSEFRKIFVPSPGTKMLAVDYSYIELRTLSAVCEARFGFSKLADTIRKGIDPHVQTAAQIQGMTPEEFMALKTANPKAYKQGRQSAKACFSADTEVLTSTGWKLIPLLTLEDEVANFWPGVQIVDFSKPFALSTRDDQPLLRLTGDKATLKVTPDHRVLGWYSWKYPRVVQAKDVVGAFTGIWTAGDCYSQGEFSPHADALVAALYAEKVPEELQQFFLSPGVLNCTRMMALDFESRQGFLKALKCWHVRRQLRYYATQSKETVATLQAMAAITGWRVDVVKEGLGFWCLLLLPQGRVSTKFKSERMEGLHKVHCLTVASSFVVVRCEGTVCIAGNCNFGIPGGLGPKKLVEVALANYQVHFTEEEASLFRKKIVEEIYPEWGLYLSDSTAEDMGANLSIHPTFIQEKAAQYGDNLGQTFYCMGKVLKGQPINAQRFEYSRAFQDRMWRLAWDILTLSSSRRDLEEIRAAVKAKEGSPTLYRLLYSSATVTATGRIRGGCGYTQARNGPFQGLAADGAKMALWRLTQMGKKLVGFIHDEILFEVPEDNAEEEKAVISKVLCEEMEKVMEGRLPVGVEADLGDHWIH